MHLDFNILLYSTLFILSNSNFIISLNIKNVKPKLMWKTKTRELPLWIKLIVIKLSISFIHNLYSEFGIRYVKLVYKKKEHCVPHKLVKSAFAAVYFFSCFNDTQF